MKKKREICSKSGFEAAAKMHGIDLTSIPKGEEGKKVLRKLRHDKDQIKKDERSINTPSVHRYPFVVHYCN